MGLTGDYATVAAWQRQIGSAGKLQRRIAAEMAEEAVELIREGFERERDPYGKKWAKLKRRSGRILQDTGALRNGIKVKLLARNGFRVGPTVKYATFHQSGTKHMVARRIVPSQRLPARWLKRLRPIPIAVLKEHLA